MTPDDAKDAAVSAVTLLCEAGIPSYVLYCDEAGWHLAGPSVDGKVLADALRAVAAQCEETLVKLGERTIN